MTKTEVRKEVDYQVAEYDIDTNEAIENVADEYGIKFKAVHDTYFCKRHMGECTTDDHRGFPVRVP